jgi:chemotaxis protein CheX
MSTASAATAPPYEIDPALIVPFAASARKVLRTMAGVEARMSRPKVKLTHGPEHDYSGIISLSGAVVGIVVVSLPRGTAIRIVAAFAGAGPEVDSVDFSDAIGELTNLIAGSAKNDIPGEIDISIPAVVMGRGHVVARPQDVPCLAIGCETDLGELTIEVSIRRA